MRISDVFTLLVWLGGALYAYDQPHTDVLHAVLWPLSAGAYLVHFIPGWVASPFRR